MLHKVVLLLGCNLGDKSRNLTKAVDLIGRQVGRVVSQSGIYVSEPWGFTSEDEFFNQSLVVETELSPGQLLKETQEIESKLGRTRSETGSYESRTMDIDILYFDDEVIDRSDLVIPHQSLHQRKFTLLPLAEVAPDFMHPLLQKTNTELLASCKDESQVSPWNITS